MSDIGHKEVLCLAPEGLNRDVRDLFEPRQVVEKTLDLADTINEETQVLWALIDQKNFNDIILLLETLGTRFPNLVVIGQGQNLDLAQIERLINNQLVFKFVLSAKHKARHLNDGIVESRNRRRQMEHVATLKRQNQTLETIQLNLEQMVEQRTQKEFNAHTEADKSLRDIQSLLNFVKNISRCRSLEELLIEISSEIRRLESVMPPLLLLKRSEGHHQAFFFQSRQLVERVISVAEAEGLFKRNRQDSQTRQILTHLLGRPVGPLAIQEMRFQSSELSASEALLVFEYGVSLARKPPLDLMEQQKWSLIRLALESLLLKDNVRFIAKQWAETFNQMVDPILIMDRNFQIRSDNKHLGAGADRTCYKIFAGRDKPCLNCPLGETLQEDAPRVRDVSFAGRIFQVHSFPIHLESNRETNHVVHQYVDVTSSMDLRGQVIQGEKMAAIGLLAGNIAHELNNPLTGIRSMSDLLLSELASDSTTAKDLTEVRDAAIRCQNLIRDLLDFSSLGGDAKIRDVDLNEIVAKTVPLLKVAMRMINTDIQTSEVPLLVRAHPQLLQQVVFNLIHNACQAMEEGGDLLVQVFSEGRSGFIRIRDTGPGIPEEMREKIFEPFYTTKKDGKGTGLGLSLARSIVERFGGTLKLVSPQGPGSEFLITLPRSLQ